MYLIFIIKFFIYILHIFNKATLSAIIENYEVILEKLEAYKSTSPSNSIRVNALICKPFGRRALSRSMDYRRVTLTLLIYIKNPYLTPSCTNNGGEQWGGSDSDLRWLN